jgi:hypothetical protein
MSSSSRERGIPNAYPCGKKGKRWRLESPRNDATEIGGQMLESSNFMSKASSAIRFRETIRPNVNMT